MGAMANGHLGQMDSWGNGHSKNDSSNFGIQVIWNMISELECRER